MRRETPMKSWLVVYFMVVWVVALIYVLQKKRRQRTIATTHRADHSPAVQQAYQRQWDAATKMVLVIVVLFVSSLVAIWIGRAQSWDMLVACGITAAMICVGLLGMSVGEATRCPVCRASIRRSGSRFCPRCGAQVLE
jgi:hypothetical protein